MLKKDLSNLKNTIALMVLGSLNRGLYGVLHYPYHCSSFLTVLERPDVKVMKSSQIFAFAHLDHGGLQSALPAVCNLTFSFSDSI